MKENIELGKRISSRGKRKVSLLTKTKRWFKSVFKKELMLNKIVSIILIVVSVLATLVSKGDPMIPVGTYDCTVLILALIFAIPMFFAKRIGLIKYIRRGFKINLFFLFFIYVSYGS